MDTVQFVDSISASPTVRLNLNDGVTWGLNYQGTDISPPPLKTAWASSLLVDGERLTAAAYGNRTLRLALDLMAASPDAAAAQEQALWRELDRPSNLLMWKPEGATNAVFFQTIRSSNNRVTELPGGGGLRLLDVEIEAKPFGIGLRETLATQDIVNNPASPNGHYLDLATIKGDVPAPLYLQIRASDVTPTPAGFTTGDGHRTTAIAMRRGGTPSAMPAVLQAESMTMSTDTTVQAAIASSSGQFARTTFVGNPNLTSRATIAAFPATPSVDARGTYRVFVRCRKSVAADVVQVQLNYVSDDAGVFTDKVSVPSTVWRWVDLGLISMPLGYDPVTDALSGIPVAVQGLSAFLYAARVSGTGTLDVDVVMHMPADDRLCYIQWPQFGSQTNYVVDAVANMVYATSSSGEIRGTLPEMASLPPMVSPGVANRVWLMRDVGAEYVSGDDIAAQVRVTPYYYPQYLRVRGATS